MRLAAILFPIFVAGAFGIAGAAEPEHGGGGDAHAPAAADAGHGDTPAGGAPAPKKDEHASFAAKCFIDAAEMPPEQAPAKDGEHAPEAAPAAEGEKKDGGAAEHAPAKEPEVTHATDTPEGGGGHAPAAEEGHAAGADAAAPAVPSGPLPGEALLPDPNIDEPYRLVRALELLQDQIAIGNREAHTNQRALIVEIEKKLFETPDALWRKPINSRAAILYGLSGGNPKIFEKLLAIGPLPCLDEGLLKGLLAYSQGQNQVAKSQLAEIDPHAVGERAGAHIALAEAMLLAGDKPNRAIEFLDLVRILAPGTLLEEAALRRETVIAALMEELEKFEMLTSQYMRRFGKAVYASEFVSRFAVAVVSARYATSDADLQRLSRMLDSLDTDMRRTTYLAVTQAALVRGQLKLTQVGAGKLSALAKSDPTLAVQAKLYEGAALLVTDKYDDAAAMLRAIDRRALGERDRPLLDAALQLAVRLRQPPDENAPVSEPPPVSAEQGKQVQFDAMDSVLESAKVAIGSADELLAGEKR